MADLLPEVALAALLGLVAGGFLNVLIHRLPIMIEQSWQAPAPPGTPTLSLAWPGPRRTARPARSRWPGATSCP